MLQQSAPASGWSHFYVPEIHDIHPGMETMPNQMLDVLPQAARDAAALLVVPNWGRREPLLPASDLAVQLRSLPNEKILHGYAHTNGPDFFNWVWFGHDDRSEFASLSAIEEHHRLVQGRNMLETAIDFQVRWFCAPRWRNGPFTTKRLAAEKFFGFCLRAGLETCAGASIPIPALCFDDGERRVKSFLARQLRRREIAGLLSLGAPFRLTLHPSDFRRAGDLRQLRALIGRLEQGGWQAVSINEALSRWQAHCEVTQFASGRAH